MMSEQVASEPGQTTRRVEPQDARPGSRRPDERPTVHLFEPSGYAGVFQHACRVGELLDLRGWRVVLHTGHEHECVHSAGLEVCPCSFWPRGEPRGALRSLRIAAAFLARTLPHVRRAVGPKDVLHVQGIAAAGALTLIAIAVGSLGGRRVVYSPHDTFSRRGAFDDWLLRLALRVPQTVIAHSKVDVEALRAGGIDARYAPLVQLVPAVPEPRRAGWREAWGAGDDAVVVLFAGSIRPERRLDLLIESARSWPPDRRLAVVGEDRGAWKDCAALARRRRVDVAARVEFVELGDFCAAIAAADLVVAPHDRASQSGVLSLARQLGTPTVAASVGGLGELASRTFPAADVEGLRRAVNEQLEQSGREPSPIDEELATEVHLDAYAGGFQPRPSGPPQCVRRRLMGMPLDGLTRCQAVRRVMDRIASGQGGAVLTPNVEILRHYRRSAHLRAIFERTELSVADGTPLVWASRIQGAPVPERVTGSDMLWALTAAAAASGRPVFLAGGRAGVARRAADRLGRQHPGLQVSSHPCFVEPGPIGRQVDELIGVILDAAPDIVFIGLPFATQVYLTEVLRSRLPQAWMVGVGSTFDLVNEDRPRAPGWLQRIGFEWAHRIVHEPHVWRRYLIHGLPVAGRLGFHALRVRLVRGRAPKRAPGS